MRVNQSGGQLISLHLSLAAAMRRGNGVKPDRMTGLSKMHGFPWVGLQPIAMKHQHIHSHDVPSIAGHAN
jgi:hypothetical protein